MPRVLTFLSKMLIKIIQPCFILDRVYSIGDTADVLQDEAEALIRGQIAETMPVVVSFVEPVERTAVKKIARKADKWRNQS